MKKIIKRKLHISTYSRDFIDYINHEFYSHDKHNAFFEFTVEQLPTDNVVALFYFQKTKRYAEIKGTVEDNKVTIEFDTSLITTNETVCGYIYFEKVEQSADVCRFCFNVKVSEIDKLKNAPVVEKETRRLIPMSEIVTKAELQELFKTIEKNGGTYNDTEIRKSITSIEERVQTLETKPDNNTVYDDSELSRRVSALETKEDKDTVYNDEEIKRRLSNLEGKTDNFISGVSVNKEGNNVTLTYNYVDGQAKNVSFTDSDTINIAYDDSALKTRLNDLENRPQIDVSEFAKKTDIPQAYNDSELSRRVSALETKEDKDTVYNDEEIKRRLSNLEGKTDNFISGVSVNKEGNNVTLTYNYVDGQAKNVSFTDSDTINIAYDDSALKTRLNDLENRPQIDVSEFAKKTDIPQAYNDSELSRRVSALETKEDKDTVYNDEEIKRRLSNLEGKTDNFISGVSVNKEGNNVTLTYNYVDGQTKNVSFTDSDTVNIAYDDSALKTRLNDLENRPQIDVSEFAKKSEVPTAESVMDLTQKFGEHDNKIQILEAKVGFEIHGTGMPNGRVTAPIGTTYIDTAATNGAIKWMKYTGDENTGWRVIHGDTGWVLVWQYDTNKNVINRMYCRRINDVVHVKFNPKINTSNISHAVNLMLDSGTNESDDNLSIDGFKPVDDVVQTIFKTASEIYSTTASAENSEGAQGTGAVILQYEYAYKSKEKTGLKLQILTSNLGVEENHVNPFSYLTEDEWPATLPTL